MLMPLTHCKVLIARLCKNNVFNTIMYSGAVIFMALILQVNIHNIYLMGGIRLKDLCSCFQCEYCFSYIRRVVSIS